MIYTIAMAKSFYFAVYWIFCLLSKIALHCFWTFPPLPLLMFMWNRGPLCLGSCLYYGCFSYIFYVILFVRKMFLTSSLMFLSSVYLSFVDQLNVDCFNRGLPALGPALPSACSATSVMTLIIALVSLIVVWATACISLLCFVCLCGIKC